LPLASSHRSPKKAIAAKTTVPSKQNSTPKTNKPVVTIIDFLRSVNYYYDVVVVDELKAVKGSRL